MAKRVSPKLGDREAWTPEKVRERIRIGVLVTRLENHVLGKAKMTPTQVRAAEILLRKTVPDLAQIEQTIAGEITHHAVNAEPMSAAEWEAKYGARDEPAGAAH